MIVHNHPFIQPTIHPSIINGKFIIFHYQLCIIGLDLFSLGFAGFFPTRSVATIAVNIDDDDGDGTGVTNRTMVL